MTGSLLDRRTLLGGLLTAPATGLLPAPSSAQGAAAPAAGPFWPGGARLAVSVTVQFEADGGQREAFQPGPGGTPEAARRFPDFPVIENRTYGATEGMPRLLDMLDRVGVRMTSFMIGRSIERYPDLAREVVARGHEAGGRQRLHAPQFHMAKDEERAFLRAGFESYRRVLGSWPKGYNAWALQGSVNTDDLLQELGLVYSIDDRTRDEPWIRTVNGDREFLLSPYMGHVNDLSFFENRRLPIDDYERTLRREFETLHAEGAARRRMMSVPLHDFVAGRPAYMPSAEGFIRWARAQPGVWFARRDEIADWALGEGRALTPKDTPYVPAE